MNCGGAAWPWSAPRRPAERRAENCGWSWSPPARASSLRRWIDALRREGVAVEQQTIDCLIAATDRLAAEVTKPDTLGVLLTPHWAAALCLANRRPGVRAVVGLDLPAAAAATAAVGANLLVIDPDGGTMFQWKQMLAEFCRGGVRPCPPVFQKQLG